MSAKADKTGSCSFCGQTKIIQVPEEWEQGQINEAVTCECECEQAQAYAKVITRSNGLCERCKARGIYKPGYIVHHKEYITPGNISNPNITLNLDNLEYVCEDCHNKEHKAVHTPMRYQYDANGNLLPPKENNKSDHTPGVQNLTPGKRTEGVTSKKLRKVARI